MGEEAQYAGMAMDLVGQGANMLYDSHQSKKEREWASAEAQKNRDFQSAMYQRQLSDNIAWRTHQEEYNSPAAQMKRFADAGINPMYYVTGANGGTSVNTPSFGGSYGSTPVAHTGARGHLDFARSIELQNSTKVANAQSDYLDAQANLLNTEASLKSMEKPIYQFNRDIYSFLLNHYVEDAPDGWTESVAYFAARNMFHKIKYELDVDKWSWEDAKDYYLHQPEIRAFARDLNEHQRNQFQYEMRNAKNASQMLEVQRKWAKANQWINATTKAVGAALGLFGAFKGTSMMPITTNSTSTSTSESDVWHHKPYGQ